MKLPVLSVDKTFFVDFLSVSLTKILFILFLQIRGLSALNQSVEKFNDEGITTIEEALKV